MGKKLKSLICAVMAMTVGAGIFAGCGKKPNDENQGENGGNQGGSTIVTPPAEEKKVSSYIRTDKGVYCAGEEIFLTSGGGEWVGIFKADGEMSSNAAKISYFLNENGMSENMRYVTDIYGKLSKGDYVAVLFGDRSVNDVKAQTTFKIVDYAVYTDKSEYYANEDIVVTAYGGDGAWVGLYAADENPQNINSICWYYIQKETHLVGQSYILQRTGKYNRYNDETLPAGEYKVVLFSNDAQSSAVTEKAITIKQGPVSSPSAPVSATYTLDDPYSGKASGTLKLNMGENNGYASEVVAYWADDNGKLADYMPFAPQKVDSSDFTFTMLDNVYIPAEATKIRFYGKNIMGMSDDYLDVDIPLKERRDYGKPVYTFNVISDIHVSTVIGGAHNGKELYNTHFKEACQDMADFNPKSEGMFIVGDIANSGQSSEWKKAAEIIESVEGAPMPYYTLGNHDLYNNDVPYDTKIQDFLAYTGKDKAYYEEVINGIHHLALGSQEQDTSGGVHAKMHRDQLDWLEDRLEDITSNDKTAPVFVYFHQSLYNTIAGSLKGHNWNGVEPNDELQAILAKYPQVILFNGHSHWIMESYRNAYFASNKMSNVFNTSSVAYLWSTTDNEVEVSGSQGYYVDIYKDCVIVRGRDFATQKWIPSACYVIERMK